MAHSKHTSQKADLAPTTTWAKPAPEVVQASPVPSAPALPPVTGPGTFIFIGYDPKDGNAPDRITAFGIDFTKGTPVKVEDARIANFLRHKPEFKIA